MPTLPRRSLNFALLLATTAAALTPSLLRAAPEQTLQPQQESDDIVSPLHAKKLRDAQTQARIEAVSHYMTGRLLQSRGKLKLAYAEFQQAVAIDPQAVEIYRDLVPLAFQLEETKDAISYATRAVELDPQNVELLQQLATSLAGQRRLPDAIRYLEQAAAAPALDRYSPEYVLLVRNLGILYLATGQNDKAADQYEALLDALKSPTQYGLDLQTRQALLNDKRTSLETTGQVLLEAGRAAPAGEAFELAKQANKISSGNYSFFRAKVLLLTDKPEEALAELQPYFDAQRQSKGRDAYQLLADILQKLNRSDELLGRLEGMAKDDSRNNTLQYYFAERLAAAEELDRARSVYEETLKDSSDTAGYMGLAEVLRKLDRPRELLDVLAKAVSRASGESLETLGTELETVAGDEKMVDQLLDVGRQDAKADPQDLSFEKCYLLAKLAGERKKYEAASEFYELSVPLAKQRLPLVYSEWGQLLAGAKRYEEAAKIYRAAADKPELADRRPNFLYMLSQILALAGDTDGALVAVADALKEVPDSPLLLMQEAWIYSHAHRFDEAVSRFEKVIERFPDQKDIVRRCQSNLSNIFVLKGELRKGEEVLEKIFAENPEDPGVNNDLGYLYADQGKNLEQAEQMIRKAIAAEPDNAAFLDSLGWVLFKRGKFEEARGPLEEAIKQSTGSGDATLYDHLGDCLQQLKMMDQAVEAWKTALEQANAEKHPDTKVVERLQQKLKEHAPQGDKPKPAAPGSP